MSAAEERAPVWGVWLLIGFSSIVVVAWLSGVELPSDRGTLAAIVVASIALLFVAARSALRMVALAARLAQERHARSAAQSEVAQLQTQNAMLDIIARSADVPLAFQALADRVSGLVPCHRVGLALLSDDRTEFETYTARTDDDDRRTSPRPEIMFKVDRTLIGSVVRSREMLILADLESSAPDYLDANVLMTSGFRSLLFVPLICRDRAVGTLNVVSRRPGAFTAAHGDALYPIAEILAVAWVAQQLHVTLGKHRTLEAMTELTLSVAAEINSALQTIIGHCDLLERDRQNDVIQHDLRTISSQAERIMGLLDRMRVASQERMRQMATDIDRDAGVPDAMPDGETNRRA